MKKNLIIFSVLFTLVYFSCSSKYDTIDETKKQELVEEDDNLTIKDFEDNVSVNLNSNGDQCLIYASDRYEQVGIAHNKILSLLDKSFTSQFECDVSDLQSHVGLFTDEINIQVNNYADLKSVFTEDIDVLDIFDLYSNKFDICSFSSNEIMRAKLNTLINNAHQELSALGVLTQYELDVINIIMTTIMSLEEGDQLDFNNIYNSLSLNSDKLYREGEFTYSLLSICEHSFCYWRYENTSTRWFWTPLTVGLDAAGGFLSGVKNLVDTGAHHDPNNEILTAIGSGAVGASALPYFADIGN